MISENLYRMALDNLAPDMKIKRGSASEWEHIYSF